MKKRYLRLTDSKNKKITKKGAVTVVYRNLNKKSRPVF